MNTQMVLLIATCMTDSVITVEVNRDGFASNIKLQGCEPVSISGRARQFDGSKRARMKSKRCVKCNTIVSQEASCCWKCGSKRIQ